MQKSYVRGLAAGLGLAVAAFLAGCAAQRTTDEQGQVYHCVGMTQPIPPANTWAKKLPVEKFEYGSYQRQDTPTIGGAYDCLWMRLPKTAYLRYRVDGKVVEKIFDLSALTPSRVHKSTVEFFVDNETVEVRLLTPVPGKYIDTKEVIERR